MSYVYVMANDAMPGIYKVGYTARPPHIRAKELSKSTSVPCEFELVCFAKYPCAREWEREFHKVLQGYGCRVSDSREFFKVDLEELLNIVLTQDDVIDVWQGGVVKHIPDWWTRYERKSA
jgi:hypothetical protein